MRRSDRARNEDGWIRAFLHRAPAGALATVHEEQPFINSNLFVYDEADERIYLHTANSGRLQSNLRHEEKVCFTAFEMGRLLPADVALEFSVEYSSVIVFGRGSEVADDAEATRALQLLLDKYFPHLQPGVDYRPPVEEELRRTAVYRIAIDSWTGKEKKVEADFPGALWYKPGGEGR
jgi:nitroimidazol reductase NimA-like FMN-containing flavoprotein (pyridoxamine 5'-phosphate oxidase superfamily)